MYGPSKSDWRAIVWTAFTAVALLMAIAFTLGRWL